MKTVEGKVVVLGHQGVGKTSLVVRYIGKMFSHHITPTIGASYFTCKINLDDARVKLQVWDTAGQERFRAMAPMYYRNANAALLVYDITQLHTFKAVQTWAKELQRNVQEPMAIFVVGNKLDLSETRAVSIDDASTFARSIGGEYFEVSALTDLGIEDVFLAAALGLSRLSNDSRCQSLRVFCTDTESGVAVLSPIGPQTIVVESAEPPRGTVEKVNACC